MLFFKIETQNRNYERESSDTKALLSFPSVPFFPACAGINPATTTARNLSRFPCPFLSVSPIPPGRVYYGPL